MIKMIRLRKKSSAVYLSNYTIRFITKGVD